MKTSKTTHSATPHKINITPVILAGGKGLRLRPLTSPSRAKSLVKFLSKHSFLQRTILRVPHLNPPIIVCAERDITKTHEQLNAIGCNDARIIAEPEGKSTAIAITLAATLLQDQTILVLPCDHAIKNSEKFEYTIATIASIDLNDKIISFGAPITNPSTQYGYIQHGAQHPLLNKVTSFTEKPDRKTAKTFKNSENYLWNTGIFITNAAHILREVQTFHPEITDAAQKAITRLEDNNIYLKGAVFQHITPISIDHAIMEKTKTSYVTNLGLRWTDTGTWKSLLFSKFGMF